MQKVLGTVAVLAGLMTGTAAHAQSWGVYFGNGNPQPYAARWYGDDERQMQFICSGQRSHMLEDRLRHEVDEGEIDPDKAERMHAAIDRQEDGQRRECAEGDWRAVRDIARRYDRINQWMDREAHGGEWRPRW